MSEPPESAKGAAPKDRARCKTLTEAFDHAGNVKADDLEAAQASPRRVVMVNRLMPNPPQAMRVTRPSRSGNPHRCDPKDPADRDRATAMFEADLYAGRLAFSIDDVRRELRGWHLVCHCPNDGHGCHAEVLVRVANGEVRK
jgi:hypothetical protein